MMPTGSRLQQEPKPAEKKPSEVSGSSEWNSLNQSRLEKICLKHITITQLTAEVREQAGDCQEACGDSL